MIKKLISASALLMLATTISAQQYITFDFGGGINNVSFDPGSNGTKKVGAGIATQIGYRYFFNDNWGAGIGVGFNTLSDKATLTFNHNEQNGTDPTILTEHKERNYLTEYNSVEEKVKASTIDIPIGAYYNYAINDKWSLNAGVNLVVSILAGKKFESKAGIVNVSAELPYYNVVMTDLPQHNLSTYSDFDGTPDFKSVSIGIGGECKAYYALNDKIDLSIGIGGVYRFSDIQNQKLEKLFNPDTHEYVGITQTSLCSGVKLISFTGTVGIRYHLF
ncbi:MAG: outer membrane beta-barrel protein [Bacteroidales bacterium]|nr:outer membrane beta-barrel protein [Bacteroidales bacterium]